MYASTQHTYTRSWAANAPPNDDTLKHGEGMKYWNGQSVSSASARRPYALWSSSRGTEKRSKEAVKQAKKISGVETHTNLEGDANAGGGSSQRSVCDRDFFPISATYDN